MVKPQVVYRGEDAVAEFLRCMETERTWIMSKLKHEQKDLVMTLDDERKFQKATRCYMCQDKFDPKKKGDKCRDHDHFKGTYRGAAHRFV